MSARKGKTLILTETFKKISKKKIGPEIGHYNLIKIHNGRVHVTFIIKHPEI